MAYDKPLKRNSDGEVLPQHWDPDIGDWVVAEKTQLTQVTGRNVEELVFFDGEALTDTLVTNSGYRDVHKYKKMYFIAVSSLDVEVSLGFRTRGNNINIWDGESWQNTYPGQAGSITIQPGLSSSIYLLNHQNDWLNHFAFDNLEARVRAEETPSEGSISIIAYGVIN